MHQCILENGPKKIGGKFLKEIENMFSLFLSSYKNTRGSLGELEEAEETLACGSCSQSILVLSNFHSCFYNSIETRYMFSSSLTQ